MTAKLNITPVTKEEAQLALDWAAAEGWNPGLCDAAVFYETNRDGFFIGKLGKEPVVVASNILYDDRFSFFGLLIVKEGYRRQGYGMAMTRFGREFIGQRNTGLDGVVEMQPKYMKEGFKLAHKNYRFSGQAQAALQIDPAIKKAAEVDFNALLTYDRLHFPAPRENFLAAWIAQPNAQALAYYKGNYSLRSRERPYLG